MGGGVIGFGDEDLVSGAIIQGFVDWGHSHEPEESVHVNRMYLSQSSLLNHISTILSAKGLTQKTTYKHKRMDLLLLDRSQEIKSRCNLCLGVVSLNGSAHHGHKPTLGRHLVCV